MKQTWKRQPRIAGVKRWPKFTALIPEVQSRVEDDATHAARSESWVQAQIVSAFYGYDASTGEKLNGKRGKR
jgi:hypothetical protein